MQPKQLTIIGVGLLGGSIGLALRSISSHCKVIGYGHRLSTLHKAVEFGAIDEATVNLADAVRDSDLVILCTPVGLFEEVLKGIAKAVRPGTIITDVGSTKRTVVQKAECILDKHVHFVGSHPMAGSEKRGVEYARADLFQNATCIVTPTAQTDRGALKTVEEFWRSIGMHTTHLSPEEHDATLADISHLPHVLAAALVSMQATGSLPLAGKGFLDTTRIAGGDGALWRDILLDNRDNVRASLKRLQSQLKELSGLLKPEKSEALIAWLNTAAQRRETLLKQKLREVTPD